MRLLALAGASLALTSASQAAETIIHPYDARGRVVQVARSGTVNNGVTTTYQFDKTDNRSSKASISSFDPAPTGPTFTIGDATAVEGNHLLFTVTLSGTGSPCVLAFSTIDETATGGPDYSVTANIHEFQPGQTTSGVAAFSDSLAEESETFKLRLETGPANCNATLADEGLGTITDP